MATENGTISKQLLKSASGEFDIESIHSLVLKSKDLSSLGCIGECASLERLNLSYNDISKLYPLAGLTNLTYLNLAANRVSSLEGLQALDNLKVLNIAGNLIGSLDALYVLAPLDDLEELRLLDKVHDLMNPVCRNTTYKKDVVKILPKLKVLDGERLSGKGSDMFKMCEDIDTMLKEKEALSSTSSSVPGNQGDWLPKDFFEHKASQEFDKSLMGDAKQQLEALLEDCKRVSSNADIAIQAALQRNDGN